MANWDQEWNHNVAQMHAEHAQYAGQLGGLTASLIDDYHFRTHRPDKRAVPLSIEHLEPNWKSKDHDTIGRYVKSWDNELMQDGFKRGVQALSQMQSHAVTNRRRGIATQFTRELSYPGTGEETHTLNYSYMPAHPTRYQIRHALGVANDLRSFTDHHRQGEQYHWAAPGQPFRHESPL